MPKVFQATIGGRKLFLFDLSIEDCEDLGKRHNISWLSPIDSPLQSAGVARDVVAAVVKKLGMAMPLLSSVRELYDIFELVDDDLPAEYVDGIPKEDGVETATTG